MPVIITAMHMRVQIMAAIQTKAFLGDFIGIWVRGQMVGGRRVTTFGFGKSVYGFSFFMFKVVNLGLRGPWQGKNLIGFLAPIGGEGFGIFFSEF